MFHPAAQHIGLGFTEWASALLRRHEVFVVLLQNRASVKRALGGVERDNVGRVFACLKGLFLGADVPFTFGLFGVVARHAVLLKYGLNVFNKVDARTLF